MKITIIQPNEKGQLIIPKPVREAVGMSPTTPLSVVVRGKGLYLFPITDVLTNADSENSYLSLLKTTRGSWEGTDASSGEQKQHERELDASSQRKRSW